MSGSQIAITELLAPLESPRGGFAMLALDQRESLRRMFPLVDGVEVDDEVLRSFKRSAIGVLSPLASGILLDRPLAVMTDRPDGIADDCGLILAADVLEQPEGQGVVNTTLDPVVTAEFVKHVGAVALKLLVIWRPGEGEAERAGLVRSFVALAEESGVASLVEGIVRPGGGVQDWPSQSERHEAIIAAAAELSSFGGSIYKAEVPGYVPGDVSLVREHSERLSEVVTGPWVVLSNGVAQPDFADAVREACTGGARGFLAGRAIWADTVAEADPVAAMTERSTQRLRDLTDIVANALES
jgi:sulfofructosephosphate aldolase